MKLHELRSFALRKKSFYFIRHDQMDWNATWPYYGPRRYSSQQAQAHMCQNFCQSTHLTLNCEILG